MKRLTRRVGDGATRRRGETQTVVSPYRPVFPSPRRAFTLIELLVVIAIIAILAAILFPVFAKAREKSRQAACLSNCKQIGNASAMYTQDFDERLPVWGWDTEHTGARLNGVPYRGRVIWPILYLPYIKNDQVFSCLSDRFRGQQVCNSAAPTNCMWAKPFPISLGTNLRLHRCVDPVAGQSCFGGASNRPLAISAIIAAAETYWIADISVNHPIGFESGPINGCQTGSWQVYGVDRIRFTEGPAPPNCGGYSWPRDVTDPDASTRHSGGSNIIFTDGHAKWLRWTNIKWQNTCPAGVNAAGTGCITP